MNKTEFFDFEEKEFDFPFYRNLDLSCDKSIIGLVVSVILFTLLIFGPVKFLNYQEQLILFFAMLIPLLVSVKGKFSTFFRKPKKNDLKLVLLCFIGDFGVILAYGIIHVFINFFVPVDVLSHTAVNNVGNNLDVLSLIMNLFQIIGEELFRVTTFLLLLTVFYRFLKNRRNSVIISAAITLFIFGLFHANSYDNILYSIVLIGFGSIFTFYPYLKTKNVLLSVIVHVLYNLSVIMIQGA